VTERFRDHAQQQAVCDRILRLAHYNLETVRSELLHMGDVARVRRARTLYDLALALWDGDGQLAVGHLVDLDRDTRTMIGDLLAELGVADHSRIDRWLSSTESIVEAEVPGSAR
jgi:hypothetical protein